MKFSIEDKMCLRKRRYPSEEIAIDAIGKMIIKYPEAASETWRFYKCPNCLGFHVTKTDRNNPKYEKRRWMAGFPILRLAT